MLIAVFCLIGQVLCQSEATLNQPPYIETNTYTLRKTSASLVSLSATINFIQNYTAASIIPQVASSLASLYTFTPLSTSSFTQSITNIQQSYFTLNYQFACTVGAGSCTFAQIDIVYVAYDSSRYPFVQISTFFFTLSPTVTLSNQYYQMQYMNPLSNGHTYQLNMVLAGFTDMQLTGEPGLYVDAVQSDTVYYLLNVQFSNLVVANIQLVRTLIDVTAMNNAWVSVSSLISQTGTIYLFRDPLAIESNAIPDYIPFGLFYGIKGFTAWNITLTKMPYIFINVVPRMQANIGYTLFLTKSCSVNQSYVSDEDLCYGLSAAFYYQTSPGSLQRCPASCYQCVGPLATSCKSCVEGYNRYLSGGRCLCISGFYDPGAAICLNCTLAIPNCKTCSSATLCITCYSGCTLLSQEMTFRCDCPWLVQNISTNCPLNFYYEYDMSICQCYPQTYYSKQNGICLPCKVGCYICVTTATYCLVCLDMYTLVNSTCMYFYTSYSLLGLTSNVNSPQVRCLRWSSDNTKCLYSCRYYYYQQNCYFKCPVGTFNLSFPWKSCQPCKINCLFCYNFSVCYKCATEYYYFNTAIIACSSCSPNCVTCLNSTYCTLCEELYQLSNGSCGLPQLAYYPSCTESCVSCLVQQTCQKCRATYYLNVSSGSCINCQSSIGLLVGAGGICKEICGDGLLVNHGCDDGNQVSGDGCSSTCAIEDGFECTRINNRSYCWNRGSAIFWKVSTVFGRNQIVIDLWSNTVVLSENLVDVSCSFNFTQNSKVAIKNLYRITIAYHESILMFLDQSNNNTRNYFLTGNASNMCTFTVNRLRAYPILINTFPESLYVSYDSAIEGIVQSSALRIAATVIAMICLSLSVVGLAPLSSFSSLRVFVLIVVSYMDYSQIPINSFVAYTGLGSLLLTATSNKTSYLSQFDSDYYSAVLWRLFLLYAGTVLIHEMMVGILLKISKARNWKLLNKSMAHLVENKSLIYQTMYSSYEIVVYVIVIRTIVNFGVSSTTLSVFVFLHLVVIIATKLHFCFTKEIIEKSNSRFCHVLMISTIENVTVALLIQFSTQNVSFTALLIITYALVSFVSLFKFSRPTYTSLPPPEAYSKTQAICSWQYRCNLLLLILIQVIRLANMWRGLFISDPRYYEYLGEVNGMMMVVAIYLLMLLSMICTVVVQVMRLYELNAMKEEEEVVRSEPMQGEVSGMGGLDN